MTTIERTHEFAVAGNGTSDNPKYYRCKLCGFARPVMNATSDMGCHDGLRKFYLAVERDFLACWVTTG